MKKAKIMLASIAIVGVIGGAFAFKAHNYTGTLFCSTTTTTNGIEGYTTQLPVTTTLYCTTGATIKPTKTYAVQFNN